jgi:hypothetical protein
MSTTHLAIRGMSTTRLAIRGEVLCAIHSRSTLRRTGVLADVDCLRCSRALAASVVAETNAWAERRLHARKAAAARAVGLGPVWDFVAQRPGAAATAQLLTDLVGSLAVTLLDLGYQTTSVVGEPELADSA